MQNNFIHSKNPKQKSRLQFKTASIDFIFFASVYREKIYQPKITTKRNSKRLILFKFYNRTMKKRYK